MMQLKIISRNLYLLLPFLTLACLYFPNGLLLGTPLFAWTIVVWAREKEISLTRKFLLAGCVMGFTVLSLEMAVYALTPMMEAGIAVVILLFVQAGVSIRYLLRPYISLAIWAGIMIPFWIAR